MPPPPCKICFKPSKFICSSCGPLVNYCSKECQAIDWPEHKRSCQASAGQEIEMTDFNNPASDEEQRDNVVYYIGQIYTIIKPVLACIFLSVFWIKMTRPTPQYFGYQQLSSSLNGNIGTVFTGGNQTSGQLQSSVNYALIIMGQIIGATILVVILYKFNCMKVFYGMFSLIILMLFGFFGYVVGSTLAAVYNQSLDFISFIFILWNIAFLGLASILYKGPLRLQQVYLVVMSSLMAFSLTSLPDLTTWLLLGLLVVWDLIAVLCPFGPLKILVEQSKKSGKKIPALLYATAIWLMAHGTQVNGAQFASGSRTRSAHRTDSNDSVNDTVDRRQPSLESISHESTTPLQETIEEDEDEGGLKLGLGDFVFYSVLIARASVFDWVTTISCTIAVTAGLSVTIFLLAVYQKALPALPISIAFGILFYFVSSVMLTPYINQLYIAPQFSSELLKQQTLWVGTQAAGFVMP